MKTIKILREKNIFFKILFLLILIGFNSSYLFSQEEKDLDKNKDTNVKEKNHQFGFTIKRANYAYYPVEYENDSQGKTLFGLWDRPGLRIQSELFSAANPKKLSPMRNNEQVINPFSLLYYNKNLNLNFEFSRYSLVLDSPYYVADIFGRSITPHDIGNIRRSENKLNVYSNTKLNESNSLFYGLGARNIKKENYLRTYITQDSILDNTYGINLFLKYQYKIISNLSINFSVEPFYTYGARNIKRDIIRPYGSSIPTPVDFRAAYNDPHAKIYFYGAEFDINVSLNIYENLNLLVGYGFIYTKVRYENDRRIFLTKYYSDNYLTYSGIYIHSTDHINNWYIGLNAKF